MKIAIWIVFVLLAAVWSGAAWAAAALLQGASELVASGGTVDLAAVFSRWSLPTWLVVGLDLSWLQAVQLVAVDVVEGLRDAWPAIGSAIGWLVPLVWVGWGIGIAVLLLLTGVGHWLAGRRGGRAQLQSA